MIPVAEWDWISTLRAELPRLLWKSAGICREAPTLEAAIAQVSQWRQHWNTLHATRFFTTPKHGNSRSLLTPKPDPDDLKTCMARVELWGETRNLLDIGELILKSAAFRQESRGGHYRSDFPATTSDWRVHTLTSGAKVWRSSPIALYP